MAISSRNEVELLIEVSRFITREGLSVWVVHARKSTGDIWRCIGADLYTDQVPGRLSQAFDYVTGK